MKRILQILALLVVLILPFFPITANFFPPDRPIESQHLVRYLLICVVIIIVGLLFILFQKPKRNRSGILLVAIGFVAMIPLHLGPPRMNVDLLAAAGIEKFRYGLLILATLLLAIAGLKILLPAKTVLSKLFLFTLCISILLNFWDNYSSFMLSSSLQKWIADGKSVDDFVTQFDHQIAWRTFARILLYKTAIVLSFTAMKNVSIKKGQMIVISLFSFVGIVFCCLCLASGFQNFYFPFMVPAIALAPSYWLGIAILIGKKRK